MSIARLRYDEHGQAMVFVVITLITLIIFISAVANVGRELSYKIELQNTSDNASVAGAVWESRGLNLIAGLNQGIVLSVELIILTITAIAVLSVCSATLWWAGIGEACASALPLMVNFARKAIPRLWNTAKELSKLEKKIAEVFPYIVPAAVELASGADTYSPVSITYPYRPSGDVPPPLTPEAISLNVDKGTFSDLIKAIMSDIENKIESISPLLAKAFSKLGKSIDLSALAPNGSVKTSYNDNHSYGDYTDAVNAYNKAKESPSSYPDVSTTKKVDAKWHYITTTFSKPDPCAECTQKVVSKTGCMDISWIKNTAPDEKFLDDFVSCVPEDCSNNPPIQKGVMLNVPLNEKVFCKLDMSIETTTKSKSPSELPLPMKLHERANEFLYIAVATTDLGKKRRPVFISNKTLLPEDKNPWGFLAFSQSKPQSKSTGPGDVLLEMDWDAHLTKFTALRSVSQQLKLKSSNFINWIDEKLILH